MPRKERILVVDDDQAVTTEAKIYLEGKGYDVDAAYDRTEATIQLDEFCPDLLVLDLRLPLPNSGSPSEDEGIELLRLVLHNYDLPVIMRTIVDNPKIEQLILDYGADNYVKKTESDMPRLAAHIKNLLRRYPRSMRCLSSMDNKLCLNPIEREVQLNSIKIPVGQQERFKLLHYLMLNSDEDISAGKLLWEVWGEKLPDLDCEDRRNKLQRVRNTVNRLELDGLVDYIEYKQGDYRFKGRVGTWRCREGN